MKTSTIPSPVGKRVSFPSASAVLELLRLSNNMIEFLDQLFLFVGEQL